MFDIYCAEPFSINHELYGQLSPSLWFTQHPLSILSSTFFTVRDTFTTNRHEPYIFPFTGPTTRLYHLIEKYGFLHVWNPQFIMVSQYVATAPSIFTTTCLGGYVATTSPSVFLMMYSCVTPYNISMIHITYNTTIKACTKGAIKKCSIGCAVK